MCVMVTGCAGFIGSHLVERLLAEGYDVVGVDCFTPYYERGAKERNLTQALQHPRFRFHEHDLASDDPATVLKDVEIVFHLAGQPGVRASWGEAFAAYATNNVLATERLLYACANHPLQRFVFAGSSSIYGDSPDLPWRETTTPEPRSPYAITKLAAEHLCQTYRQSFGVPTVILRYFTVYGPRQRPDMALYRFLRAVLIGQPVPLFGTGEQSREFTFVDDIISATVAAASAPDAVGGIFNVGGGSRTTVNELLELIGQVTGLVVQVERRGEQAGDVRHTWGDMSRAIDVLGYAPRVSLAEGVSREFAWLRDGAGADA